MEGNHYAAEMARQDFAQLPGGQEESTEGRKITGRTMELLLNMTEMIWKNIREWSLEKLVSFTMGATWKGHGRDVEVICTVRVTNGFFDMVMLACEPSDEKAMDLRRFTKS